MTIAAVSLQTLQTACLACANAIDGGDFATARVKHAVASALLMGLPQSSSRSGLGIQYRQNLDGLKVALDAAEAASLRTTDRGRLIQTSVGFQ